MCVFISQKTGDVITVIVFVLITVFLLSSGGGYNRGYDYYEPQIEGRYEEP